MNEQTRGWTGEAETESISEDPLSLHGFSGYKNCVVCGAQIVYVILALPSDLYEWRCYCEKCNFLERFTMPIHKTHRHTEKYVDAPGFMYFLWEFIE